MMDAADWLGLAGIGGTLLAGTLTPLIAERARREGARQELLRTRRVDIYADLIRATARLVENARIWAAAPTVDLKETPEDEWDILVARVEVIASKNVHEYLIVLAKIVGAFNMFFRWAREYRRLHRRRRPGHGRDRTGDGRSVVQAGALTRAGHGHADQPYRPTPARRTGPKRKGAQVT
ncbi:MAG TPA: hypothetical protein VF062_26930 [Candidatus Limnocylindrales bacterium]